MKFNVINDTIYIRTNEIYHFFQSAFSNNANVFIIGLNLPPPPPPPPLQPFCCPYNHVDVIKWKHFPRYWSFVLGIHRSPVNSPHKGQWRGALTFSLICNRINGWANNGEVGDLRRHRVYYDVTVMITWYSGNELVKLTASYIINQLLCG